MAEILEIAQLAQDHRVPEVEIGRGGVEPQLDLQRRASLARALELGAQLRLDDDVGRAASEDPSCSSTGGNSRRLKAPALYHTDFERCKARTACGGCPV